MPIFKWAKWTQFVYSKTGLTWTLSCADTQLTGQNFMYEQIFVYLPPHKKMYHRTKLPFITWTPSCYFWLCDCSFYELGLREGQRIKRKVRTTHFKENMWQYKWMWENIWKSGEIDINYVNNWSVSYVDTWWCTVECPRMTSFTVYLLCWEKYATKNPGCTSEKFVSFLTGF